jgi:hypothetical protein
MPPDISPATRVIRGESSMNSSWVMVYINRHRSPATNPGIGKYRGTPTGRFSILSVPAMFAEEESVFSSAKLTLSDRRVRLQCEIMDALKCLRHWYGNTFVHGVQKEFRDNTISVNHNTTATPPTELSQWNTFKRMAPSTTIH